MTDTEILEWLVKNDAIDGPVLSWHSIMGTEGLPAVRIRLDELTNQEETE